MKPLNCVQLLATPWTVAYQAPLSMGFSRQEYWSVLPFPSPGDLPDPEIESGLPRCRQTLYCLSPQGSPLTWLSDLTTSKFLHRVSYTQDLINLTTSQRPIPNIITFQVRAPTWNLRGVQTFSSKHRVILETREVKECTQVHKAIKT